MEKEYRNKIRTRNLIRETFVEMVEEKGDIDKITVKELIERADIAKGTFYNHYSDINAVTEDITNEIIHTLKESLKDFSLSKSEDISPYLERIMLFLEANEKLYKKFFVSTFPSHFIEELRNFLTDSINQSITYSGLSDNPSIRYAQIDLAVSGGTELVVDYFRGVIKLSLLEIGDLIWDAIYKMTKN
ncbi:MAG: TetR/AcrR family transcriptional regulator [Bacillales bacterium]|nr:TetR/AcrR family transcriptional regulator [Bacillales bacterium]